MLRGQFLVLVLALPASLSLQVTGIRSASLRPALAARHAPPNCQFGKPEREGLTRDNEPDQYFETNFDKLSDAEKFKQPGVYIGLAILVLPFIVGAIALQIYR